MFLSSKPIKTVAILLLGFIAIGIVLFPAHGLSQSVSANPLILRPPEKPAVSGNDLVIQSTTLDPAAPAPGQPTTVTVVIKNMGTVSVGDGFYTYLYIDPPQQPPTTTTLDTNYVGWFLGLNPGATFTWSYTDYVFDSAGCNHKVYAWVDRDNEVVEDNEGNNLSSVSVCVGVENADVYEPDNTCALATALATNGSSQSHNFLPAGDQDWYQFTGIGGVEYVIRANNIGTNVDASLSLFPRCTTPPSFGGGQEIRVTLPVSGTYYIKAVNHAISATQETSYTISINAGFDCSGFYEPNDLLTTAKDILTDGTSQLHQFCAPSDEDWVKFTTQAGVTYTVQTIGLGPAATPVLMGIDPLNPAMALTGNPLRFAATMASTFYVRATNTVSTAYGSTTNYSLTVATQTCLGDEYEPDNSLGSAQSAIVNGSSQAHNFCPAGDPDWVKFTATAGITYTLETIGLGAKSDTVLCLRDNLGTQIACDDDEGVNHGSRLTWQATAGGDYFVEIQQAENQSAGAETAYELSIVTGLCRPDLYEPDNASATAHVLPLDGSRQSHNFCPAADHDWTRLDIPADGAYTIETSALAPGSDTVLNLYDTNGTSILATNDDYGLGLASQIVYNFLQAGTYYIEGRHFNPARFGRGTSYMLSASAGTPAPTPTPGSGTPTPTPTATSTPPPSGLQTLILTDRERLTTIYGITRTTQLFDKLIAFAGHAAVQGEILEVDSNSTIATAYTSWKSDLTNVAKANDAAAAIRAVALNYLAAHPSVQYIVLVGDDRVIPLRRIADRTSYPENVYTSLITTTSVGAAIADNYFFTDDYYADRQPGTWQGAEIYIPDWAIGRLVETPEEISNMLDTFMNSSELTLGGATGAKALVVGYDFVQDVATNICELLSQDLGNSNLDCTLINDAWNSTQFRAKQLNANPPFKFQSINGHASHASQGAPIGNSVTSYNVVSGTSDLSGAVIYSVGCHSGLNVPETSNFALDLPQAFAFKRANYIGNTGFGWGSRIDVQFTERVMQNYTQELLKGTTATIGKALVAAKQRYYQEATDFEDRDEKVMQQVVLYGLPMYRVNTGAVLGDENPFPSAVISTTFGSAHLGDPVTTDKGSVSINIAGGSASVLERATAGTGFTPVTNTWGSYYQLDGHTDTQAIGPIQPRFYTRLAPPPGKNSVE